MQQQSSINNINLWILPINVSPFLRTDLPNNVQITVTLKTLLFQHSVHLSGQQIRFQQLLKGRVFNSEGAR